MAPHHPGERVEPIQRADDTCEQMDNPVGSTHMFKLVDHCVPHLRTAPFRRIDGDDNGGTYETKGRRSPNRFIKKDLDRFTNSHVAGKLSDESLAVRPRQAVMTELSQTPETPNDGTEKRHDPDRPDEAEQRRGRYGGPAVLGRAQ